jgi:tyrosine-specific transport protein
VPPTLIALRYHDIFITALDYAGGFSCALLFGLLPPLMVWMGRYVKKYSKEKPQLPGGKVMLVVLMAFVVVELVLEVMHQISKFTTP